LILDDTIINNIKKLQNKLSLNPHIIDETALERVDEIKMLEVILYSKMTLLPQMEAIISKLLRVFGFIKNILRNFHDH
jgi:hypothetical protein